MLKVATSEGLPFAHTLDEQGLVLRDFASLIFHAANRYACRTPGAVLYINH